MRPFRDRPIRQKLLLTTLASSVAALLLVSAGFLLWEVGEFRADIQRDMETQARIIGDSSVAALEFRDERVAEDILSALRLRPRVTVACLYTADDALLATYQQPGTQLECPSLPPVAGHFGWATLGLVSSVELRGERRGTLYIQRELTDVRDRLLVSLLALGGLLVLAALAALLAASRIQQAIVAPLQELADTARRISSTHNYSLRATPGSGDEIGVVIQAFNEMLGRTAEALERERESNRLKDEFLATLSHELRTPLNAVLGWAQLLRVTRPDAEVVGRALDSIERNARAQARLIEDLLEVSRIIAGKLRVEARPVDLAGVVQAAAEVVRPSADARRVRLEVALDARPAMTIGDADRLQQVVWNLLSNAVKFTPPDGVVKVRLARNGAYRLMVRDTGIGIDPAFLPHIFDAFRQADGGVSREHGGLGLGLTIARQLVELHGGTIRAESAGRGTGTLFEVTLPAVPAEDGTAEQAVPRLSPGQASQLADLLRGLHVLVVDDERDARELVETVLTQYGAEVSTAASVAEAFAVLDDHVPDLVLSDIGMPREDGYALITRLRLRPPSAGGHLPAIAITAYASATERQALLAAGYQAHVAKPFDPASLVRLVAGVARRGADGPADLEALLPGHHEDPGR